MTDTTVTDTCVLVEVLGTGQEVATAPPGSDLATIKQLVAQKLHAEAEKLIFYQGVGLKPIWTDSQLQRRAPDEPLAVVVDRHSTAPITTALYSLNASVTVLCVGLQPDNKRLVVLLSTGHLVGFDIKTHKRLFHCAVASRSLNVFDRAHVTMAVHDAAVVVTTTNRAYVVLHPNGSRKDFECRVVEHLLPNGDVTFCTLQDDALCIVANSFSITAFDAATAHSALFMLLLPSGGRVRDARVWGDTLRAVVLTNKRCAVVECAVGGPTQQSFTEAFADEGIILDGAFVGQGCLALLTQKSIRVFDVVTKAPKRTLMWFTLTRAPLFLRASPRGQWLLCRSSSGRYVTAYDVWGDQAPRFTATTLSALDRDSHFVHDTGLHMGFKSSLEVTIESQCLYNAQTAAPQDRRAQLLGDES
jgi:hypothetical protein